MKGEKMFNSVGTFQTQEVLSQELTLFECGFEDVKPREPYQYEKIDYYLIHYILEGEGLFFINDEVHRLSAGEGFVIPPDTKNNYYPLSGNPWSYRWIGIRGSHCETILKKAGLLDGTFIYKYNKLETIDTLFKAIYDYAESGQLYGSIAKIYEFFNCLIAQNEELLRFSTSEGEQYVLAALDIIKQHYANNQLQITDICDQIKIERSYLYKLFKRYVTTSPQQYLIQFRLNKASELLRKTNYSIEEVAQLTGFSSYSHFSKIFSKYKGYSPHKFRLRYRVH